jgi:hypothetical protein
MSSREERIGLNEAVFRQINERIEDLSERFNVRDQKLDLICECGDENCMARISMTHAEYDDLRSDPRQFAVFPGHEYGDIEDIVARREGYDVVRKREGEAAELAEASDSRS